MKSLGQVAYEKNPIGGMQKWGYWSAAPQVVRDSHEELARIVVREHRRRETAAWRKKMQKRLEHLKPQIALFEYNAGRE